jgi:DNA modification methylase
MTERSPDRLEIVNPKRQATISKSGGSLFPYYAGYSFEFASRLLESARLDSQSLVLDPWAGSGTTVHVAQRLGLKSVGIDLNPAIVVVARGGLVSSRDVPSLVPLAKSILEQAQEHFFPELPDDPLHRWLQPEAAHCIRSIETSINRTLVCKESYRPLSDADSINSISSLAAFFYVGLFRAVRQVLSDFVPTNPTWVKTPRHQQRKRPSCDGFGRTFLEEISALSQSLEQHALQPKAEDPQATVNLGTSERIPLPANSADLILSSPPYCTRIDYAMATAIELAVLRFSEAKFDSLRRSLMGASTVSRRVTNADKEWGSTCVKFLKRVYSHRSKASKDYYYKNHVQYFGSLHNSMANISRVLKKNGNCVLVVQDSYYKEVHNDLPTIVAEMAARHGMAERRRQDYRVERSMAQLNGQSRRYLSSRNYTESVLCLVKA